MAQESDSDPVPPTPAPVTVNTTLPSTPSSSKPQLPLKKKADLLYLLRTPKNIEGLRIEEIQNAYPAVMDDLASLQSENLVYVVGNVVYPNDPRFLSTTDQDIKEFCGIDLPKDIDDLDRELRRGRIMPTKKSDEKRAAAKRRAAEISKAKSKKRKELSELL